ncbi:MAG: hypothetical protein K2R98_06855 [Gemmataceae bacterium]|nr:hypothetical protein [Gemmataceae bacterium]
MGHNRAGVAARLKLRRRRRDEKRLLAKADAAAPASAKKVAPTGAATAPK